MAHKNTSYETLQHIRDSLPLGTNTEILDTLKSSPYASKSFRAKASKLTIESPEFQSLRDLLYASLLTNIIGDADNALAEFFGGVRYIEPLRATAQRYYRLQELAVDEIDSKGANVAMFIDSLSFSEKGRLNKWLEHYFGVNVTAESDGGHVALRLQNLISKKSINIADIGFGFSQLLPIVLQLWSASQNSLRAKKSNKAFSQSCIVIEQPELHLHPAYQAKIADVFVAGINEAREVGRDLCIIAETHSPHLINRIGHLIHNGQFNHNDVQIVLFENDEGDTSIVQKTTYDHEGVLKNWPFGFFEPEE